MFDTDTRFAVEDDQIGFDSGIVSITGELSVVFPLVRTCGESVRGMNMKALYLSAFSNNLGDRQASLFVQRDALNFLAKNCGVPAGNLEVFPDGFERDFADPETWGEDFDFVLVGGAGLLGPRLFDRGWRALRAMRRPIAILGVGENIPNSMHLLPESKPDRPVFVGLRHSDSQIYFPCPSLASDVLLTSTNEKRSKRFVAGYFHHRRRMKIAPWIPYSIKNNQKGLEEVVQHLTSARFIVTDSYHGALWGRAVGARVVLLDRWRRRKAKFRAFPNRNRSGLADLRKDLIVALGTYAQWLESHVPEANSEPIFPSDNTFEGRGEKSMK